MQRLTQLLDFQLAQLKKVYTIVHAVRDGAGHWDVIRRSKVYKDEYDHLWIDIGGEG